MKSEFVKFQKPKNDNTPMTNVAEIDVAALLGFSCHDAKTGESNERSQAESE